MADGRQHLYRKRDRLGQLRAFCYAAKFESMAQAAEHLLLSPPAVSLHVRELEHELGASLFDRKGPRIVLSEAGACFYQLARPLVEGLDDLSGTFAEEPEALAPSDLPVFSGDLGGTHILPRALKRLRDESPEICVRVSSGRLSDGLPLLLAGEVKLVLAAAGPVSNPGPVSEDVIYRQVLSYDLVLITALDHPLAGRDSVSPEEIAACPVIVPDFGMYSLQGGGSPLRRLGVEANAVIEVSGWDVVERCVEAGLGVAFFATFGLTRPSRVSAIPLGQYFQERSYGWFMLRDKPLPRQAERLVEATEAEFAEGSRTRGGGGDEPAAPSRDRYGRGAGETDIS